MNDDDPMESGLLDELREEASYFCGCLFGRTPSVDFVAAYVLAHEKLPKNLLRDRSAITKIVQLKLDAIAIEFASRQKLAALNLKLLLICYLAENSPGYENNFVLKKDERLKAFFTLLRIAFETPYLYFKGQFIVKKHGLI